MATMVLTLETSQCEMSPLNALARVKRKLISVTLDVSQLERSPLNDVARINKQDMSVIFDTSQPAIGPCELDGPSPLADNVRHASTAPLSSGLDCGENTGMGALANRRVTFKNFGHLK